MRMQTPQDGHRKEQHVFQARFLGWFDVEKLDVHEAEMLRF